jgi:catechol 2,3-dioxygenase-like lactoylglutathione lyase family enzyme
MERLDHIVLTVTDVEKTKNFYVHVMGMKAQTNKLGRVSLMFGQHKINLHQLGNEFRPHAQRPTPGSGDLCFVTSRTIEEIKEHVESQGIVLIEGPVQKEGALGPMMSIYFRDPDGNLIEISRYPDK